MSLAACIIHKEEIISSWRHEQWSTVSHRHASHIPSGKFERSSQMDGSLKNSEVWGRQSQFHTSSRKVEQSLTDLTPLFLTVKEIYGWILAEWALRWSQQTTPNIWRDVQYAPKRFWENGKTFLPCASPCPKVSKCKIMWGSGIGGRSHLFSGTGHLEFADVKYGNLLNPSKSWHWNPWLLPATSVCWQVLSCWGTIRMVQFDI